jgi:hypothetical protein
MRSFQLFSVNQRSETPNFSIVTYAAKKSTRKNKSTRNLFEFFKKIEEV